MKHFAKMFDPLGVSETMMEISQAWLKDPEKMMKTTVELSNSANTTAYNMWERWWSSEANADSKNEKDRRFKDSSWSENPYFADAKEFYLWWDKWSKQILAETPDISDKTRRKGHFWTEQFLNAMAPTNFLATNPEALKRCFESGGKSLVQGYFNWLEDLQRGDGMIKMVDDRPFEVGKNLATSEGQVVFRNDLMELVQYQPTTETVHSTPLLIVPPWINKYYILDLDKKKSMVGHLVAQGFTVFMISWKNPTESMRDISFSDYMERGAYQAVQVIQSICGEAPIHAIGYCLGGTLLSTMMAWLNRKATKKEPVPIAHWTTMASMSDFSDPGVIKVFLDEQGFQMLEELLEKDGFLDSKYMGASFRLLHSKDLLWSYFANNYLKGETPPASDFLYWNCDGTRMPQTMHSFYLKEFYQNNCLTQADAITLAGQPIDLECVTQPLFCVAAQQDHIAPWKTVFNTTGLVKGDVQFALSSSGHIGGIVNPPVVPSKRKYWTSLVKDQNDPEAWQANCEEKSGSWWEPWLEWLRPQCGNQQPPPSIGNKTYPVLTEAPGTYVFE